MTREQPIATYRPALRAIKLYNDRIESPWGSGSLRGVQADVIQTGNKRLLGDDRQTHLTIVGPELAISVLLPGNEALFHVRPARKFAAKVNQAAMAYAEAS